MSSWPCLPVCRRAVAAVRAPVAPRRRSWHGQPSPARASDLTAQDRDLMPEHQDFRILGGVTSCQERQPAEQPDHEQVGKTYQHERRAWSSRSGSHTGFWHGTGNTNKSLLGPANAI